MRTVVIVQIFFAARALGQTALLRTQPGKIHRTAYFRPASPPSSLSFPNSVSHSTFPGSPSFSPHSLFTSHAIEPDKSDIMAARLNAQEKAVTSETGLQVQLSKLEQLVTDVKAAALAAKIKAKAARIQAETAVDELQTAEAASAAVTEASNGRAEADAAAAVARRAADAAGMMETQAAKSAQDAERAASAGVGWEVKIQKVAANIEKALEAAAGAKDHAATVRIAFLAGKEEKLEEAGSVALEEVDLNAKEAVRQAKKASATADAARKAADDAESKAGSMALSEAAVVTIPTGVLIGLLGIIGIMCSVLRFHRSSLILGAEPFLASHK